MDVYLIYDIYLANTIIAKRMERQKSSKYLKAKTNPLPKIKKQNKNKNHQNKTKNKNTAYGL